MSNTIKILKQMQVLLVIIVILGAISGFLTVNMVHYYSADHQFSVTVSKIAFLIIYFSIYFILAFCFINLEHITKQIKETVQTKDKTGPETGNRLEEQPKEQGSNNSIDSEVSEKEELQDVQFKKLKELRRLLMLNNILLLSIPCCFVFVDVLIKPSFEDFYVFFKWRDALVGASIFVNLFMWVKVVMYWNALVKSRS